MRRLSEVMKEKYGEKVYRLSLSSGCTCPNRDGRIALHDTSRYVLKYKLLKAEGAPLEEQIEEAKARIANKTQARKFIAYFQSYTNTYGDVTRLEHLYKEAIVREEIVALALGTRPDCLGEDVMSMLVRLNKIKPVWIELGLQTIHEDTARHIHRGYDLPVFEDSYRKLKDAGIEVIVHVIFGLPGETREMMIGTVKYLSQLDPSLDGVKLQMLHVLRGTALGEEYVKKAFPLLSMEEYADLVAESVDLLPEQTVLHRMTGDGPGQLLLAPAWTRNKKKVLNTINRKISERKHNNKCITTDA